MSQHIKTRALRATLLLAVFALMLGGCAGNRESKIVGQWKIDSSALEAMMAQGKTPGEQKRIDGAKKMLDEITLDINEDKTFALKMMMTESGGEWALDESAGTLTLTMTKSGGKDIPNAASAAQIASKPLTLNINDGNTTLTMAQPGAAATGDAKDAMTFVKAK